ncbi:MAG: hypothetical protein Q4A78_07410 [Peptostreptococcaceae bacterium]|nr:hypothetical protein [Peptostreptococcaceae bacterium]
MGRVNGRNYDWSDVRVKFPDFEMEVQEISYDDELEKEAKYGTGNKPRGFGTGNYKASGKLSLLLEDYDALTEYAKSKGIGIYDLVIPKIVVSYANDLLPVQTDVLPQVTFTKKSNKAAQGDKTIKVDMDFIIVGVIETNGINALN